MGHITFLTYGTRGDVEPFLALALELRALGFAIRFAAPLDFEGWITAEGFDYQPTTRTPIADLVADPILEDLMHFNLLKIMKGLKTLKGFMHDTIVETMPKAVGKTDLIISHAGLPIATDLAEHAEARLCYISPIPALPTAEFPFVPFKRNFGRFNRIFNLPLRYARCFTPSLYKEAREAMGLSPRSRFQKAFMINGAPVPLIHAFSPHLIPRPKDWPAHALVTGYLFYDHKADGWQPEPALQAFLDAGAPPLYIGFGSMNTGGATNLVDIALTAAREARCRVLLSRGWAGLDYRGGDPDVFMLDDVPHHALFRLVKAVVHHGGAGTTAAGLRAGRPTLICPFGFDQPWWGALVHKRQLGPAPLAQKELTVPRLAKAFMDLTTNPLYTEKAAQLQSQMAKEAGVVKTAQTIISVFELS